MSSFDVHERLFGQALIHPDEVSSENAAKAKKGDKGGVGQAIRNLFAWPTVISNETNQPWQWVPIRQNDPLPRAAVRCGSLPSCGDMYIARHNRTGESGMITLARKKVQFIQTSRAGQMKEGDILVLKCRFRPSWVPIKRGESLPVEFVPSGPSNSECVGRDSAGRGGKITLTGDNKVHQVLVYHQTNQIVGDALTVRPASANELEDWEAEDISLDEEVCQVDGKGQAPPAALPGLESMPASSLTSIWKLKFFQPFQGEVEEQVVERCYTWKYVKRNDELPDKAVLSGNLPEVGDVYVARNLKGECGRVHVSDGRVWDIWTHNGAAVTEGHVLVPCDGFREEWRPINRDDPLPDGHVKAGTSRTDGDMYVARAEGYASGKLNTDKGAAYNIWCWGMGKTPVTSGELLVIVEDLDREPAEEVDTTKEWPLEARHLIEHLRQQLQTAQGEIKELKARDAKKPGPKGGKGGEATHPGPESALPPPPPPLQSLGKVSVDVGLPPLGSSASPPLISPSAATTRRASLAYLDNLNEAEVFLMIAEFNSEDKNVLMSGIRKASEAAVSIRSSALDLTKAGGGTVMSWESITEGFERMKQELITMRTSLGAFNNLLKPERSLKLTGDFDSLLYCLKLVDGSLVAVRSWKTQVHKGMRLVKHNGSIIPLGTNLASLHKGKFALKEGVVLAFVRPAHPEIVPALEHLEVDAESMLNAMGKLQTSGPMPASGPERKDGGEVPREALRTWQARLSFDVVSFAFKKDCWADFKKVAVEYIEGTKQAQEVDEADDIGNEPGTGKGKGPGKGPPPPPAGKGGCKGPPPPAGKGPGKGPPPPAGGKGRGKGPGKGPPPLGGGKGPGGKTGGKGKNSAGAGESESQVEAEKHVQFGVEDNIVEIEATKRERHTVFGMKDHNLQKIKLKHKTWIDTCIWKSELKETPNITDAFGGRGRLLLHACMKHDHSKSSRVSKVSNKTALRRVVDESSRMNREIKYNKLLPVTQEFGGRGFSLSGPSFPWLKTVQAARAVASLDWCLLETMEEIELDTFLPAMEIALHLKYPNPDEPGKNEEETEKAKVRAEIEKARNCFVNAKEQQELAVYDSGKDVDKQIDMLDIFERKLLPFARIHSGDGLVQKVRLYHIEKAVLDAEQGLLEDLKLANRACARVQESSRLQDLLSVMLQVTCYINCFGETFSEGVGFQLTKIVKYTAFVLGKNYSFRTVLCVFLMNLRPNDGTDLRKARLSDTRKSTKQKGPSFMELLHRELQDVRDVRKQMHEAVGLLQRGTDAAKIDSLLDARVKAFSVYSDFIEKQMLDEPNLFGPVASLDTEPEAFLTDLEIWADGKKNLEALLDKTNSIAKKLDHEAERLAKSEVALKQFAGVPESSMNSGKDRYFEIMTNLMDFVDSLKQNWDELEGNPKLTADLRHALAGMAPLQVVLKENCLGEAFQLWSRKAAARVDATRARKNYHPPKWDDDARQRSLQSLFDIFDSDGSGSVDALEFSVALRGLGFEVPRGYSVNLISRYDQDNSGVLELKEFKKLVADRIEAVFGMFVGGDGKDEISHDELNKVAQQCGLSTEHVDAMIDLLDTGNEVPDGLITEDEFEQLILQVDTVADVRCAHLFDPASQGECAKMFSLDP